MTIRPARSEDVPFLAEMLAEASFPPGIEPRPTAAQTVADPRAGRYLREWGRPGDVAVIAEDDAGNGLGAAWYRRLPANQPGYGFVADDVPEIAIAVAPDQRGQGVGGELLAWLIETARASGERALSLSVSAQNPVARRLYERAGFVRAGGTDDHPTMVLILTASEVGFPDGTGWPDWQRAYRFGALVVVPPPDLAAKVDAIRSRFDPVSAAIFGTHITLTPPFARAPAPADLDRLSAVVFEFPRSELTHSSPTTFPNSSVVYLPIKPVEPLAALRTAILGTRLFESDDRDFVPHLTLSEFGAEPEAVLTAARDAGLTHGGIPLTHVTWITPDPSFRLAARDTFGLAP